MNVEHSRVNYIKNRIYNFQTIRRKKKKLECLKNLVDVIDSRKGGKKKHRNRKQKKMVETNPNIQLITINGNRRQRTVSSPWAKPMPLPSAGGHRKIVLSPPLCSACLGLCSRRILPPGQPYL